MCAGFEVFPMNGSSKKLLMHTGGDYLKPAEKNNNLI